MLVGIENGLDIEMKHGLIEPVVNRDASEYIISHYDEIVNKVKSMGVPKGSAKDLVHDVYVSFAKSESEGNGYDSCYSDDFITLEQFVYGRLKGYSKNSRYYSDGTEVGGTMIEISNNKSTIVSGHINESGELVTRESRQKEKRRVSAVVCSASFDESNMDSENNDGFQMAYMMASSSDDLLDIEEGMAIREQLDYCLDFSSLHGLKIINILKNIDLLASALPDSPRRKKGPNSLFGQLAEMVALHDEFADALKSVILYSEHHRQEYDLLLAQY